MRSEWNLSIIGFAFVAISIASIGKHSFRIFVENKISEPRFSDGGVLLRVFFALWIGYLVGRFAAHW